MALRLPSARPLYDGFVVGFDRDIAPWLAERERCRRRAVQRFQTAAGVGVAAAACFFLLRPFGSASAEAGVLALAGAAALGFFQLEGARTEITHGLLERIAKQFGFTYSGDPGRPALYDHYRRLKLLPGHNREKFEDQVSGKYAGAGFTLGEAHLETQSSGKRSRRRTVFHGQLLSIDYPKRFRGSTVIQREMGAFNALSRPSKEFQRVGLSSPAFEKAFEAWSTDQVEAHTLLDPVVLERFQELERLFDGKKLRAAFDDGKLLIAMETGDRLSVGTMFRPIEGTERVERILKEFDVVFDLIDVLVKRVETRTNGAFSLADVKLKSAHNG
jgi:hypothetical protein